MDEPLAAPTSPSAPASPAAAHPGVPEETYHTLGPKTLWIFVLQRIHAAVIILIISIGLFYLQGQPFLAKAPIPNINVYVAGGAWIFLLLFVVVFLITFFVAWLIYTNYRFYLGDNSLKIKRGIFDKEEIAIPYRQIQDVDIERDLSFQMMGLSRLIILTAGHEDERPHDDESEGVLPAMDKGLAEWLQGQLLKRANVQKVIEEK
ncbi:MAG TPA: PH domain-containing protein [Candidatus Paceibacterota bacterium]|nr:PH domain-containing protein [Candidatus Paceibacterota bacterium]